MAEFLHNYSNVRIIQIGEDLTMFLSKTATFLWTSDFSDILQFSNIS